MRRTNLFQAKPVNCIAAERAGSLIPQSAGSPTLPARLERQSGAVFERFDLLMAVFESGMRAMLFQPLHDWELADEGARPTFRFLHMSYVADQQGIGASQPVFETLAGERSFLFGRYARQ